MVRQKHWIIRLNMVLLLYLLACIVPCPVSAITTTSPPEVHALRGDDVSLTCTFVSSSRATSLMSVDWTYKPATGGPQQTFFHFSSQLLPPKEGQFIGRVKWSGSPARGVASIQLLNASLSDNGTYSCTVRNPPDVHGSPTSQTILTVTPRVSGLRFSDVAVLLAFILLPSMAISLVLLCRMCCTVEDQNHARGYRSPIEVTSGEESDLRSVQYKSTTCCDIHMLDSDYEDDYLEMQRQVKGEVESHC
ncbi:hypothetical protein DPEC_G00298170 [Dallia pectoralis]|uniref:Uncharacterized protein n=1 Tax=Dallia pectoralis TaxID=75939 RepID=A0ACC2FFR5_DALPE|nr:hypothetical protein DPEC_G00298170 [Dallia pectoralis]